MLKTTDSGGGQKHGLSADREIKYCKECKCCWERPYQRGRIVHYTEIPAYGKKRVVCNSCKGKGK